MNYFGFKNKKITSESRVFVHDKMKIVLSNSNKILNNIELEKNLLPSVIIIEISQEPPPRHNLLSQSLELYCAHYLRCRTTDWKRYLVN